MSLTDKHIIVTGAGAGIGLGIVRQCLAAGAKVTGLDVNPDAKGILTGAGADFMLVDVAVPTALDAAISDAATKTGRLDGLVNNAGITIEVPFLEMSHDQIEKLWAVNQRAVLIACQTAGRIMAKAGQGAIVNIASNHASATDAGYEGYAATKGAIVAMTRAMAWSLGPMGVRVNSLSPGLTRTEVVDAAMADPSLAQTFSAWSADGKVNTVAEVGNAAVFLLSSASAALQGANIVADRAMSVRLGAALDKGA